MPYIFLMHMWATGGPVSGHPLNDIEAFAAAYLAEPSQYASVAEQWLQDLISNPCIVPTEARAWVIQVQEANPGTLEASIAAAVPAGTLTQYYVSAAFREAQWALYRKPKPVPLRSRLTRVAQTGTRLRETPLRYGASFTHEMLWIRCWLRYSTPIARPPSSR